MISPQVQLSDDDLNIFSQARSVPLSPPQLSCHKQMKHKPELSVQTSECLFLCCSNHVVTWLVCTAVVLLLGTAVFGRKLWKVRSKENTYFFDF